MDINKDTFDIGIDMSDESKLKTSAVQATIIPTTFTEKMLQNDLTDYRKIKQLFLAGHREAVDKIIDNLDTAAREELPMKLLTWAKSDWSNEPYESKEGK